ncbi:MAG: guanylate kinase, partial [Lachnospiraceae bacterium]|nr:guanylate kinase [Lachnospiraceae bacterium]
MSKGKIAVISGFSGAGKGTVVRTLMEKYDHYALSVSMTTRSPRDGEVHGREYYFVSHEEFRDAIDKDGFLEYAYYEGSSNNYGTPRAFVEENLNKDRHVILEIEVQGGAQVKAVYPDTVSIFIVPPSAKELVRRLVDRPDQSIDFDTVQKRLRTALR